MKRKQIIKNGGRALFGTNTSLYQALKEAYPDYSWKLYQFSAAGRLPNGYWKQQGTLIQQLQMVEKQLGVKQVRLASPMDAL